MDSILPFVPEEEVQITDMAKPRGDWLERPRQDRKTSFAAQVCLAASSPLVRPGEEDASGRAVLSV